MRIIAVPQEIASRHDQNQSSVLKSSQSSTEKAMSRSQAVAFLRQMGCDTAEHDTGCTFLEHLSGVADVLATWGEPESVSLAGLFHSIYGTELFQDYSIDFSQRPRIQAIIGVEAEALVWTFCVMDLATLDATMEHEAGQHYIKARAQHGAMKVPLSDLQYRQLITVQLADWLEQVERYSHMPDQKLGWQPGDAWKHRRTGYRKMAEKLGGIPLQAWKNTYDREPVATRNICNDVTPAVQHYKQPVIVS